MNQYIHVIFQVLTAASMKMTVFWDGETSQKTVIFSMFVFTQFSVAEGRHNQIVASSRDKNIIRFDGKMGSRYPGQ
jgi:hypothetical protein